MALSLSVPASAAEIPLYIGTYTAPAAGKGIYRATFDTETGRIGAPVLVAEAANPSWLVLSPDGKTLYAALEAKEGGVAAYRVGSDAPFPLLGRLPLVPQHPGDMGSPCHLSLDPTGRRVLAASYGAGTIAVLGTSDDGTPASLLASFHFTGTGPNPKRQQAAYAHSIYAVGNFVYACNLGGDEIGIFALDPQTGALTPQLPFAKVPPGSGPRHLAFSVDGKFVYADNEMGLTVTTFARDAATGVLTALQTLSTRTDGATPDGDTAAAIVLHPSGKWLYVSTRGSDILSVFRVGADGKLEWVETRPLGVKVPRAMAVDPTGRWLLAAGQKDDTVAVLKIDPETGLATPTGEKAAVGAPVALLFGP